MSLHSQSKPMMIGSLVVTVSIVLALCCGAIYIGFRDEMTSWGRWSMIGLGVVLALALTIASLSLARKAPRTETPRR